MPSYSAVLSRPGVARIMGTQLLARFAFGMMSLAIVLHVQKMYNSYTIAGIALGAETIGAAISGPLIARRLSKYGPRRVIRIVASISSASLVFIAFFNGSVYLTVLACLLVGLTSPPIQQIARSVYPSLIAKKQTSYLFSLDATLQEFLWVFGPVLATMITATYNSTSAVMFMAIVQIVGTYLFSRNPEIGEMNIPKSKRRLGGILKKPIVLINVTVNLCLVATFGGAEVGTVAVLGVAPSGIVIAALSLGSIVGGFAFGHRAKTKWALVKFLSLVMAGYAAVLFNPTDLVWITACWFVTGLGVAPAFATMASMISVSFGTADSAEAYGWANTGQLLGYSIGAAATGIVIDHIDKVASWYVTSVAGALALTIALATVKFNPPLDQKDA